MGGSESGCGQEGPACQRRFFEYRIVRQVPPCAEHTSWVTLVEVWEKDKTGKRLYHNSFVTDLESNAENVVVGLGRAKGKIENQQFNGHNSHGYELEHTDGHGQKTLSMICWRRVAHVILPLGDRLYQRCRGQESRRELWNALRTIMNVVLVGSSCCESLWSRGVPVPEGERARGRGTPWAACCQPAHHGSVAPTLTKEETDTHDNRIESASPLGATGERCGPSASSRPHTFWHALPRL